MATEVCDVCYLADALSQALTQKAQSSAILGACMCSWAGEQVERSGTLGTHS